jgi:erythromycin esterase-like protein/ubiquitin-protein ligase
MILTCTVDTAARAVDAIPGDRKIVLLGESTHGTEEYYRTRAEITKRLISERGFTAVVFEADWPTMCLANDFLHGKRASPFDDKVRFPQWLWTNGCMLDFFEWCRALPPSQTPEVFGMDCYSLFESKKLVISFLEKHDAEFAREVSTRLSVLDRFETGFQYADAMVNGSLNRVANHIIDTYTKIQARLQWGSDKYECSPVERLSAEQNAEVIIAADEYYRKVVSEPRGSQASWNARDQHMTTTLLRIQDRLRERGKKIVVWAHNSHVGDCTATKRGGDSFERNETWNLGQMCRATFGAANVWILGQYTHRGIVTAAPDWGQQHADVHLKPALADSYEGQLHELVTRGGRPPDEVLSFTTRMPEGCSHTLTADIRVLLSGPPRLQRWVGVCYKPQSELESHYGEMVLARCYDQVLFCDVTSALKPVAPRARPRDNEGSLLSRASTQRLMKEFQRLERMPPPGIVTRPLESDLLEWHFILFCEQPPYSGGEYHGRLNFPASYPMAPPSFRILTPSGRFEPGARLCLSMSDYHPESWNPSWSVETLLVGLLSFMYEESNAIGSISASTAERRKLAAASKAFNKQNAIYLELFAAPKAGGASSGGGADDVDARAREAAAASVCRFCFSAEGELVSPCACRGSNEWLHLECLRQWQKTVVLTQPTHPKYQTNIDTVCNVCLEPFTGPGILRSRHEQIFEFVGGAEIARLVEAGNLLVSTRESSRENLELITQHPEIASRLATWTKAVFLMLRSDGGERGGLLAVSMSQPTEGPPADVRLSAVEARHWASLTLPNVSKVLHFDGGPCDRQTPIAVAYMSGVDREQLTRCGAKFAPPAWVWGGVDQVAAVIKGSSSVSSPRAQTLQLIWGFGGWGCTQVLAEIARGGWGIVPVASYMAARPDASLEISFALDFDWLRIVPHAKLPPPSEYQRAQKRSR